MILWLLRPQDLKLYLVMLQLLLTQRYRFSSVVQSRFLTFCYNYVKIFISQTASLVEILSLVCQLAMQDKRYAQYVGKLAIVPLTCGRHVPIIADRVSMKLNVLYVWSNFTKGITTWIKYSNSVKNNSLTWFHCSLILCDCCYLKSRKCYWCFLLHWFCI
jgi:hypothetical protein